MRRYRSRLRGDGPAGYALGARSEAVAGRRHTRLGRVAGQFPIPHAAVRLEHGRFECFDCFHQGGRQLRLAWPPAPLGCEWRHLWDVLDDERWEEGGDLAEPLREPLRKGLV